MKKNGIIITVAFMAVALMAGLAFASSGGGGEHEGSKWVAFGYQLINFGVLVGLLVFGAKKLNLKGMIAGRSEAIKKNIEEARAAKESAERALAEVEEKLKTKDKEIDDLVQRAEASGQKERERLIAEGERLSKSLVEQAKTNIELELKQAREVLKKEAAEYALELAEKKIRQDLTADGQKALFEEALKRLEDRS